MTTCSAATGALHINASEMRVDIAECPKFLIEYALSLM
jgi:hypothetical protein